MKKRLAILACLFAVSFPVVPIWGQESSELNLTAGATKQIDDILLNDISDFKFGWTRTSSNVRSQRSEERRVGKECRSRWSPYH